MRIIWTLASAAAVLAAAPTAVSASTCAEQGAACLARGHSAADCQKSVVICLETGRFFGPAGREYPITKKQ